MKIDYNKFTEDELKVIHNAARMAKTEHSHPLERFNPFTIEP